MITVSVVFIGSILSQVLPLVIYNPLITINIFVAKTVYIFLEITLFTIVVYFAGKIAHQSLDDYGLPFNMKLWSKLVFGLFLGVIVIVLISALLYLFGIYGIMPGGNNFAVASWFVQYAAIGYMEELLYRGVIRHHLSNLGVLPAVIISSIIFSLFHSAPAGYSVATFVNLTLFGVFMCMVTYATGSVWVAIGLHAAWDWFEAVLGIGLTGSGIDQDSMFLTKILSHNTLLTGGEYILEGSIVCTVVLIFFILLTLYYLKINFHSKKIIKNLEKSNKKGKQNPKMI